MDLGRQMIALRPFVFGTEEVETKDTKGHSKLRGLLLLWRIDSSNSGLTQLIRITCLSLSAQRSCMQLQVPDLMASGISPVISTDPDSTHLKISV